jgi:uncharacterized membrane protein
MSIIELGALGEFVAAIAVLVTLIYLALQGKAWRQAGAFNTTNQFRTQHGRAILVHPE